MRTFTLLVIALAFLGPEVKGQYCMLPGRTSYSTDQPGITNFKLNTINRTSAGVEQPLSSPPIVVTTDTTVLERGKTYTVTIVSSKDAVNFPTAHNNIRVWIDYNKNMDFLDAGETVISKDTVVPGTFTASFTVPATAPIGYTRLRATAKMSADAGHSIPTPCDNPPDPIGYHGEMEDYTVKIVFPTSVDNIPGSETVFSVYPNPAVNTITVTFNNVSHKPFSINLFDVTGKFIGHMFSSQDQSANEYSFKLNDYISAKGVYFIRATFEGTSGYQKLIKID